MFDFSTGESLGHPLVHLFRYEMTITIGFGWWLLPMAVTIIAYGFAISKFSRGGGGDYSFPELWNGILLIIVTIPVLIAWLIWALAT